MKVNAISLNETQYYQIASQDKQFIKEIRSTYCYDPESGTYLCELTPSYDLRYLHTYIVWNDDPSDDKRDELDQKYCYEGGEDIYMHVSSVRSLPFKRCGEFDDINEACEYLQGNWHF